MHYTLEMFTPLLHSTFTAHTQAGPVELVLVEAAELPRRGLPASFRTPMSLIFEGSTALVLAQDIYEVDHPSLGKSVWSMVPISTCVGPTQQYQVSFS